LVFHFDGFHDDSTCSLIRGWVACQHPDLPRAEKRAMGYRLGASPIPWLEQVEVGRTDPVVTSDGKCKRSAMHLDFDGSSAFDRPYHGKSH
jgi:hypothetical protein